MAQTASARTKKTPDQQPARHRAIDLVHLAKQTLGDRNLEQEVLRIFQRASNAYLQGIRAAKSHDELKLNLHSLKGASAGIGANGIAEVARNAEAELRDSGNVSPESIADIGFAVEEVSVFISDLLKG